MLKTKIAFLEWRLPSFCREGLVTKSWSGWVLFSTYYVWVDLVPLAFSESKEYMVGCEGDSQGSTQDWGAIVELVNDQVNPGQEFFIVHLQLVRARARFTNRMGLKISAWQNKNEGYTVCKTSRNKPRRQRSFSWSIWCNLDRVSSYHWLFCGLQGWRICM